ncbi:unnamed protein product [Mytilus coruscus]|uniref:Tyr recombinase domain-containing protein n=1 Tax=Mytilus coruscus TaxID=42192 RepID=A0A6J8ALB6_MYTCO|nr:unnamed protein product [Mytilus coruscus]
MKDLTFKKSRGCLMAKKKHLKELGLDNLPNAAEAIESDEEEELFSSGAFGTGNPDSLLGAVCTNPIDHLTCSPESPFYLGVNRSVKAKYWYKCQPLGEKKLQNLMKDSVKKSNVCTSKKLTNHSGRKTAITRLLDEGMPVTAVQQHTGHKSLESINNYAKNSIKTQKRMCDILDKKEIKTALNERPESTISSTGNRPQPFEFLPKGTVINGGTFNFVFGSNDWDPNKNQKENISPPEPKPRRAMVIYSDSE